MKLPDISSKLKQPCCSCGKLIAHQFFGGDDFEPFPYFFILDHLGINMCDTECLR